MSPMVASESGKARNAFHERGLSPGSVKGSPAGFVGGVVGVSGGEI